MLLKPAERGRKIGFALKPTVLRRRGIVQHHRPALGLDFCKSRFPGGPHQDLHIRVAGLVEAIAESARLAGADL